MVVLQLNPYMSGFKPNPLRMFSHYLSDRKLGRCRKVYGDNQIHGGNKTMLQNFLPFAITKIFFLSSKKAFSHLAWGKENRSCSLIIYLIYFKIYLKIRSISTIYNEYLTFR